MKKEDILLVIALPKESDGIFEKKNFDILYTGVGKVNATYFLTKKLLELKSQNRLPKYVINIGSCGSRKFHKGKVIVCDKFIQRDMDATIFSYKLGETPSEKNIPMIIECKRISNNLTLEYATCGSGDNFALKPCEIEEVDVVDMEAYALAKVCYLENINFISLKYVTDGLDEDGGDSWDKEVKNAGESLSEFFDNFTKILDRINMNNTKLK
jgi:adenosylhomocysteine nucleosidase